jgi:hypothetical protein
MFPERPESSQASFSSLTHLSQVQDPVDRDSQLRQSQDFSQLSATADLPLNTEAHLPAIAKPKEVFQAPVTNMSKPTMKSSFASPSQATTRQHVRTTNLPQKPVTAKASPRAPQPQARPQRQQLKTQAQGVRPRAEKKSLVSPKKATHVATQKLPKIAMKPKAAKQSKDNQDEPVLFSEPSCETQTQANEDNLFDVDHFLPAAMANQSLQSMERTGGSSLSHAGVNTNALNSDAEFISPFQRFSLKPKERLRSDWEPRKIAHKVISEEQSKFVHDLVERYKQEGRNYNFKPVSKSFYETFPGPSDYITHCNSTASQ